jgi:AraC-like DNA-binding protein
MSIASTTTEHGRHLPSMGYPPVPFLHNAVFTDENRVFSSADMDEVRCNVGRIFKPHSLKIYSRFNGMKSQMHHVQQGNLSMNLLQYQNEVLIDPARLDDFYLIHIPITGKSNIRCGNQSFVSTPEVASLISPTLPLNILWEAGSTHVILRIERARVERHCAQHLGIPHLEKPLEFDPALRMDTASGIYFSRLLGILGESLTSPFPQLRQPMAFEQFESTLINALLYGQANNLPLDGPVHSIAPFYIKRVEDYIHAHAAEPMTIEALAEKAGVSARTLFAGFQRYREISPMDYVRQVRLEHVREELLKTPTPISVTDIALKWGFNHLGRFSIDYKRRFGESPSATVRYRQT